MDPNNDFETMKNQTVVYQGDKVSSFELEVFPGPMTNITEFNYTWSFLKWDETKALLLKINFNDPNEVSREPEFDELEIRINDRYLFRKADGSTFLEKTMILNKKIGSQLTDE